MSTILHAVFLFELDPYIKVESFVESVVQFNFKLYPLPDTCRSLSGAEVPIPTLPSVVILTLSGSPTVRTITLLPAIYVL